MSQNAALVMLVAFRRLSSHLNQLNCTSGRMLKAKKPGVHSLTFLSFVTLFLSFANRKFFTSGTLLSRRMLQDHQRYSQ
jgi:hypothetical protein